MARITERHRDAERRMRDIIDGAGLRQPDEVEYDDDSIWLRWDPEKLVVEIDLTDAPAE